MLASKLTRRKVLKLCPILFHYALPNLLASSMFRACSIGLSPKMSKSNGVCGPVAVGNGRRAVR